MPFSKLLIAATLVVASADVPTLTSKYCADVVETLTVEGSAPQTGRSYTLCVDNSKIRYSTTASDGSSIGIFNGTDYWHLTADTTKPGGWNCSHKVTGPEQVSFMPYRMTTMDPGTHLNKTETYDGIKGASDFSNFRPSPHPPNYPSEYMHWHAAPAAKGAATVQMLATDCTQKSGSQRTGPWQHGVRDYSKNYGAFVEAKLPAGITCGAGDIDFGVTAGTFQDDARFGGSAAAAKAVLTLTERTDMSAAEFLVIAAAANQTHYGCAPCMSDEVSIQIQGVTGPVCVPKCTGTTCPTDKPAGASATPQCALQSSTGDKYCALICSPSVEMLKYPVFKRAADAQCGAGQSCKAIQTVGICTCDA